MKEKNSSAVELGKLSALSRLGNLSPVERKNKMKILWEKSAQTRQKRNKALLKYGKDYTNAREIVRKRDSNTCQDCKKISQQNQRKLDVHHLEEEMRGKNREKMIHRDMIKKISIN